MKKLLLLITALFILASVEGQILRYSNYTAPTPQEILVTSIDVWGTGGATTIATNGGTLQMLKKTLPTNAADTSVTWSRTNGTGTANISAGGLLTALTNGTVTARATANDGSAVYGEEEITISNQSTNMLANGTFDSEDYWFTSYGWSIGSGVASCAENANPSTLTQIGTDMITDLEPSTDYTISFDIVSASPGIWFRILDGSGVVTFVEATYYTTGHYSLDFTTASDLTIGGIRFFTYTDEENPGTIDNVTLVER